MNDKKLHIDKKLSQNDLDDFLRKVEVPYNQSKAAVWEQLSEKLDKQPVRKHRTLFTPSNLALAATLLLLVGLAMVLRFYSAKIQTPAGEHMVFALPDGSEVNLNASSSITYHPWWYRFSREINFEGEAFFTVKKGRPFSVNSETGTTVVLGTSFNIFARSKSYEVQCITGKVKVISPTRMEVVLLSDYSASIAPDGQIMVKKNPKSHTSIDWVNNKFSFTSVPLYVVFQEVERQYNVTIQTGISAELIYTGHFQGQREVEEVLELLCKPFGLQFEKISERKYLVN